MKETEYVAVLHGSLQPAVTFKIRFYSKFGMFPVDELGRLSQKENVYNIVGKYALFNSRRERAPAGRYSFVARRRPPPPHVVSELLALTIIL